MHLKYQSTDVNELIELLFDAVDPLLQPTVFSLLDMTDNPLAFRTTMCEIATELGVQNHLRHYAPFICAPSMFQELAPMLRVVLRLHRRPVSFRSEEALLLQPLLINKSTGEQVSWHGSSRTMLN